MSITSITSTLCGRDGAGGNGFDGPGSSSSRLAFFSIGRQAGGDGGSSSSGGGGSSSSSTTSTTKSTTKSTTSSTSTSTGSWCVYRRQL